jgi:hypothetical protein
MAVVAMLSVRGMSVDGDGSEGMGNDVDESKENIQHWSLEMSARKVQALEIPGATARTFC